MATPKSSDLASPASFEAACPFALSFSGFFTWVVRPIFWSIPFTGAQAVSARTLSNRQSANRKVATLHADIFALFKPEFQGQGSSHQIFPNLSLQLWNYTA
jgi:hypothetical protein